ncbi:DinB family protein [Mucilaginibacter sp.]|uniref:DinB family protein n=1 Tax=Mucilaginibacter sp. TaxID=1882438 RepID=UPI00326303D4
MMPIQFNNIFLNSFETYKVFDNLLVEEADPKGAPKTIWQILNHLIAWQKYQLEMLKGGDQLNINEQDTWIAEEHPASQGELENAVAVFYSLIDEVKAEIKAFETEHSNLNQKLTIVQQLSIHLSFHVGEVVLMRRMAGTYPMPHQMSAFLAD